MTNIRLISVFLLIFSILLIPVMTMADCGPSPSYYTVGGIVYNGAGQVVGTSDSQGSVHLFGSASGEDRSYNTPFDDGIPSSSTYSSGITSSGSTGVGMYMTSTSGRYANGSAVKKSPVNGTQNTSTIFGNASVNTTQANSTPVNSTTEQ